MRAAVYFGLLAPVVIVIASSLTAGRVLRFPPDGLSLRWYYAAVTDDVFMNAFWVSTRLATIATIISLVIGLAGSFALARRDIPRQDASPGRRTLAASGSDGRDRPRSAAGAGLAPSQPEYTRVGPRSRADHARLRRTSATCRPRSFRPELEFAAMNLRHHRCAS